ncbi:MAG: hypothetical protein LBJ20_02795 [Candidatus Methanoplasma sp.]|nr:hypothetical protein [Candidatus Methanoplasma sp.]
MVARDRSYEELRRDLRCKKIVIWTCNTCARLCNGIGGTDSAERLAAALRSDGIDVLGVLGTSASCLERKVRAKEDTEMIGRADLVLAMTCSIGALCAERIFGKDVFNPLVTLGTGFADEEGKMMICDCRHPKSPVKELSHAASEKGLHCSPYV